MGRPASIKKCPDCHQPGLKHNGTRNGKIRWRCTNFGSSPSLTRPDTTQLAQFTAFLAWIKGKESKGEVDGTRTGRTARRQFSWCWNVPIPKPPVTGEIFDEVFLDGNYLPHHWCILLARSSTGPVTTWQWCNTETAAAYQAVLARMAPPVVVAIDGSGGCQKALKETWPDVTVQRCLVHVHRNAALTLLGHDVDYLEHRDSLSAESISSANQEQLSTWFTLMTRGEYWSEGHVAQAIEAGELQAITRRLVALLAG